MNRAQSGQATVEWSGLVLLLAVALALAGIFAVRSPAWDLGDRIVHAIVCAAGDGCPDALEDAYGEQLAALVRDNAPNVVYERRSAQLPIDFRRCRDLDCSNGDDRAAAIAATAAGLPVTAFTRVVDRREAGGSLYLQYWLYFPESFTAGIGRRLGPFSDRWPGYHADDWEGVQLRFAPDGSVAGRASAHGRYASTPGSGDWGRWTGWYRVSGGSHAGQLVERPDGERTTPGPAWRLVPLESMNGGTQYRFEVKPPWLKSVYRDPESDVS